MYKFLSDRLSSVFTSLRGRKSLTEENIAQAIEEVKESFLEADVDYKVVNSLMKEIKEKALGSRVIKDISPDQQFVKIVYDRLVDILGKTQKPITRIKGKTSILMTVGMQGVGKTTTCAKLARHLVVQEKKKVLLVACDLQRPAAIDQLETLSKEVPCDIYVNRDEKSPMELARSAMAYLQGKGYDYVIFDTAGRLSIDKELMEELQSLRFIIKPHEIILVVDAMVGQVALGMAKAFDSMVAFDSVIVNKMDGDARGGVILSITDCLDKPVKFFGMGERLDDLDIFYPDRIASRILGMGDVVSFVEKAEKTFYEGEKKDLEEKIKTKSLTFNDFLVQLKRIRSMGTLKNLMSMIPGMSQMGNVSVEESQLISIEVMISSMTEKEKKQPSLLDQSRCERIARGSGHSVKAVHQMVQKFRQMNQMLGDFAQGKMPQMPKGFPSNLSSSMMGGDMQKYLDQMKSNKEKKVKKSHKGFRGIKF